MGCGVSRGAPLTTAVTFTARVEKERDDATLETIQLKRLGVRAYDVLFTDFENAVNVVVKLNNALHDALWDAKAALAYAASPDPEYALDLEVVTDDVRSVPQLLFDVCYADNNSRPLPFEVRHILTSRPAIAEADRAVADAVADLVTTLQSHPAPAQLSYNEGKLQVTVIPCGSGSAVPGAAQQYQRLNQRAARLSAALAAMRKAAPGLKLVVSVVPSPAPGARTFAWRLLPRSGGVDGEQGQCIATHASAASTKSGAAKPSSTPARPLATPLRIASAHGAAAILDAASTVAHQAAAIAAAVSAAAAPLVQLQMEGRRRVVAVTPLEGLTTSAAASTASGGGHRNGRSSNVILRSLSLTRAEPSSASGALGSGPSKGGISAASRADEAAAVLRRAVSNANRALFRLAKCATAGASSGRDAVALRQGEPSAYPISRAVTVVLEAAIHAARFAAGCGAATPPVTPMAGMPDGGGGADGAAFGELVAVEPQLRCTSDSGSVLSSSVQGLPGCGGAGGEGATPGWSWSWEWGITPRIAGMSFPECLAPKPRAVYDAVNRAVESARAITEQLPLLQRDVASQVEDAEAVFRKHDDQLTEATKDMMSACRMRAALDRNANTISASPALVGLLQSAVSSLIEELRRGADLMRAIALGDPDADDTREGRDSSQRASGSRSIMGRQLNKAAAVAAAAVAAAAAAAAAASEDDDEGGTADGRSEFMSGLGSESGGCDGGSVAGYSEDVRRSSGSLAGGMHGGDAGAGAAAGARAAGTGGSLKHSAGKGGSTMRGKPVSRRVVLPPLSLGSGSVKDQ